MSRKKPELDVEIDRVTVHEIPLQKMIPKKIYEAQQSEWAMKSDDSLIRECAPDSVDWRLRIRYNSLLQQIMDPAVALERRVIRVEDIIADVCTYEVWNRRVSIIPKAVFYSRKLGTYLEDQDALLTAFSGRLWEIASMPIVKQSGEVDHEAVKLLHRTINILLDRKFGQAVQRYVSAQIPGPENLDPIQVEKQLQLLEALDAKKSN